ncbi:MAG: UvrB/UvrC motif-containing protein [Planctomycetota bacterium]|nr:UvrB/UvrC motif-containing protein [Planctomycetota bacterium]
MKCERCSKPVTHHITDIDKNGDWQEHHLCHDHAQTFLEESNEIDDKPKKDVSELAKAFISQSGKSAVANESASEKRICPLCKMTFQEFRNTGRLGCPNDYMIFREELMPLLENIHDETRHCGKTPHRAPRDTQTQTSLIQLRNDLKKSIAAEDYELAARVRDQIKELESRKSVS